MKSVPVTIILFFFISSAFGFQPDSLLKTGNDLYAKGQYFYAINIYEQIVDSGYEASELYFNLGNAYYKVNNIPLAILNYERAKKINPWDKDIKHNRLYGELLRNKRLREESHTAADLISALEQLRPRHVYGTGEDGETAAQARMFLQEIAMICRRILEWSS